MNRRRSKRGNSEGEVEERLTEAIWGNAPQTPCNLNNANSVNAPKKEDNRMPVEFSNGVFEKGLTMENPSTEGWKIHEISGDDLVKTPKDLPFNKPRSKKSAPLEPPMKSLEANSSVTSEPQQELLCPPNFNYPHQSMVASYLGKKYNLQSVPQSDQDVLKRAMTYLHKNWMNQTMCDALVSTEDGDILTHQLVLAAHSPTLEAIFEKNKKPLPQLIQISMTDFSRDIISDVMNYLYTSTLKVDCKNIAHLIAISRQLDFPEIINKCGIFLTKSYNHDNVFLHFSVAANNHMRNSKNYLLKVIALNFTLLCQHNHFLYIPFQRLLEIISHESLSTDELEVLQALIRWFDFNRTERLQYSESLFAKVKFEQINPEIIANQVEIHDWLFNSKANKNFISQAYKFHALAAVGEASKKAISPDDNNDDSSAVFNNDPYNDNQANNNNKRLVHERLNAYVIQLKQYAGMGDDSSSSDVDSIDDLDDSRIDYDFKQDDQACRNRASNNNNKDPHKVINNIKYNDFSNKLYDLGKEYNKYKEFEHGVNNSNNDNNN